ncbi:MAG: hypothetical protein LBM04_07465 [Opitutaceae bacterium]|jgi:hypothetical protein|nr:hypothetical protein [Opitutaceae bacterium]
MKIGIISESPADEMAVRVLVEAVLGVDVKLVQPSLRARGWPSVAQVLPAVIRHLHFNTDAAGLVVVVDADDSVVHTAGHEREGYYHPRCRVCQLRGIFRQTTKRLPAARGRDRLLRCVGVAVPAVEGWYLCGRDHGVTEHAWTDGQTSGRMPYTRAQLKMRVYGTDRPSLAHEIECAMREVQRHRRDTRRLENDFPGFESMAKDLRDWKTRLATTASLAKSASLALAKPA